MDRARALQYIQKTPYFCYFSSYDYCSLFYQTETPLYAQDNAIFFKKGFYIFQKNPLSIRNIKSAIPLSSITDQMNMYCIKFLESIVGKSEDIKEIFLLDQSSIYFLYRGVWISMHPWQQCTFQMFEKINSVIRYLKNNKRCSSSYCIDLCLYNQKKII